VRNISRYPGEEYMERVRAYRHTEPYKKALRKRAVWVEPLFGEAKEWHGMARFRLRRLKKVNIEALLIASGQNIKRLLAARGLGPRSLAQAAALHLPEPAHFSRFGPSSRHRRLHRRRTRLWGAQERLTSFSTGWIVFGTVPKVVKFREGVFSEIRLPALGVLGKWASGVRVCAS